LLITRTGSLGTLAIFDDDLEAIPGAYLIQFRLATSPVTTRYLFHFLKSPSGQRYLTAKGAGVGRPNLNAPTIEALAVPLPPLAEQKRIVAEVERRLSVIDELETVVTANLARATHLRQSVLQHAFASELSTITP
jgi:type I restriction enzyme S subunit